MGQYDILTAEQACLSFECENATSLAQIMQYAFENPTEIARLGKRAREVFEQRFTFEKFSQGFLRILQS